MVINLKIWSLLGPSPNVCGKTSIRFDQSLQIQLLVQPKMLIVQSEITRGFAEPFHKQASATSVGITHVQAWAKPKYTLHQVLSVCSKCHPWTTHPAHCQSAQLIFFPNNNLRARGRQTSLSGTTAGIGPKRKGNQGQISPSPCCLALPTPSLFQSGVLFQNYTFILKKK